RLGRAPLARLRPDQEPGAHHALALYRDLAARRQDVHFLQQLPRFIGDVHHPRFAVRFHPTRGVHGVSPDVVNELALADHAGDDWTGMDADANAERFAELAAELERSALHGQRHLRNHLRVIVFVTV